MLTLSRMGYSLAYGDSASFVCVNWFQACFPLTKLLSIITALSNLFDYLSDDMLVLIRHGFMESRKTAL